MALGGPIGWALALAGCALGCDDDGSTPADAGAPTGELAAQLDELIASSGVASISVGIMQGGALTTAVARGLADIAADRAATRDTIYGLASCSKPVVGLAAAILADEVGDFDLDGDVNDWLDWDPPLAHPDHPDRAVTLRMLLDHRSGIAGDGPADYDTYPKPDPDVGLQPFLEPLLADPGYWLFEPGQGETYSNLGVALAALVIEQAAEMDFRQFCETRIFDPIGMDDTRWFYGDLSAEQKARHAIPHDPDGEPYAIYAFNDYPSGLLRSTVPDFARLMAALADGGWLDGAEVLPAAAVARFNDEGLSIDAYESDGHRAYDHSGGEAGITTYFTYRADGAGYLYLVNTDLDDAPEEAFGEALNQLLAPAAGF